MDDNREKEIEELLKELVKPGDDGLKVLGITMEDIERAVRKYWRDKDDEEDEYELAAFLGMV